MVFDSYQEYIYLSRYARWIDEKNRRETWDETVKRYYDFFIHYCPDIFKDEFEEAVGAIHELEVMPSMRALWSAGEALERDNIAGYNCSYLPIDNPKAFAEVLYILMNGTGVGFSVERQYINRLPEVPSTLSKVPSTIIVADSKLGWAEGFYQLIKHLYRGEVPNYDLSKVRPYGARLKTFGGRASGPEPLRILFETTKQIFDSAKGSRLNSLQCYDLCCFVANCVVVGGVRRSACISLSNLSDDRMAKAKVGKFPEHRSVTNNSVAYTEKPGARKLISEWLKLIESQAGERGIFNRQGSDFNISTMGRREPGHEWGLNPCGEIILRPYEFCNLSEVIIRPEDRKEDLLKKVKYATILGCLQSMLTKFRFIGRQWKNNCEEERLLGVSLTGLRDHPILQTVNKHSKKWLTMMRDEAIETAKRWSQSMGIKMPTAITCVKPSGTVSKLVNSSSGLHPRYAEYYINRIRASKSDPLADLLINQGMQALQDSNKDMWVFEFPMQSPSESLTREQVNAIDQLEYWKMLKMYWCEHNPSCTIYVKENEWTQVLAWVDANWNIIGGLSFFPEDNGVYTLAPNEEINEELYHHISDNFPALDFSQLSSFEKEDKTEGSREFACTANSCEL